jgi:integrase
MSRQYDRVVSIPFAAWSDHLKVAWTDAFPRDVYDLADAPNPKAEILAQKSLDNALQAFEGYFWHLAGANPAALSRPLEQILTRPDVESYVRVLHARLAGPRGMQLKPSTIVSYLERLHSAAARFAPNAKFGWLLRLTQELRPPPRTPDMPALTTQQLIRTGLVAMRLARRRLRRWQKKHGSRRHQPRPLVLYRDGLMIVFAALFPMRPENLRELEIGEMFAPPNALDDRYYVNIPANMTKTGEPIQDYVPRQLTVYFDYYFAWIRSRFHAAPTSRDVWLTLEGEDMAYITLYGAVRRTTLRIAGKSIRPHQFRHAAATASERLGRSSAATARIVNHASIQTAKDHYIAEKRPSIFRVTVKLFRL